MGDAPVVLVVEDEWLLRECIAAHLRAARLKVLEAGTGEAAIALLEDGNHVDVVFTDIQLGGAINGWEVGVKFRNVLPQITIIYTSGNARAAKLADAPSLFIPKPYEPEAILQACRTFMNVRV